MKARTTTTTIGSMLYAGDPVERLPCLKSFAVVQYERARRALYTTSRNI